MSVGESPTVEFGKVIDQMRMHDLFFEEIFLIQKENHRRIRKPWISDNRAKQRFALVHSILNERKKDEEEEKESGRSYFIV